MFLVLPAAQVEVNHREHPNEVRPPRPVPRYAVLIDSARMLGAFSFALIRPARIKSNLTVFYYNVVDLELAGAVFVKLHFLSKLIG